MVPTFTCAFIAIKFFFRHSVFVEKENLEPLTRLNW